MTERPPRRQLKTKGDKRRADPAVSAAIGSKLRAVYDEVLSEPVPQGLADLVKRLSSNTDGSGNGEDSPP
ncbi:MAG: NepR family anti-sigma factor [Bauldia sp.]